ncbi:alpha-L-rhamnosidase [Agromyces atrinae]|uniref:alpha-L-rhamnosidase n=1 Tax=Agromyces atrinae TaxID=592376 RepID=A0A4Q2MCM7_9MICO|nr:alpha-L-rhamnosidase [Agromyces atrinae]NYD67532.1 alpha-L-rhamnosidase [Agromyces atrinae]RXZ88253.1 hydrolase [Agromyces atrinae]
MTALPNASEPDSSTRIISIRSQFAPGQLGVPLLVPRLSWQVESDRPDARQHAYQLAERSCSGDWAVAEPVSSADQTGIRGASALEPRERREYAVRIDAGAGWSAWSEPVAIEAGIRGSDLVASVIDIPSEIAGPNPILRREFTIDGPVGEARLRLSALGLVDARLNGHPVSDALLTPGWTSYDGRVLVDTYDVSGLLRSGPNVLVLEVNDGWYRGRMGFASRTAIYGDRIGALAQLEIDGDVALVTDDTWRGGFGAVQTASIYDGTTIDLRADDPAVHDAGFDDSGWQPASVVPVDRAIFAPRVAPPVRVIERRPMTVDEQSDRVVLDSGQNVSGWVRLVVDGSAGDTVTVRHAEVLEPSGALHTAALRSARATDVYTLARDGETVLEPTFTFHGFRYADVVSDARVVSAEAVAISSDLAPRGEFRSSHEALDRFHSNVLWSQRDNFVSVPTDCPQRDERLGWTGDAQAFAATANTLLDTESFWLSWLVDLELDQTDEGGVASVVPDIIRPEDMLMGGTPTNPMGRAGWADAATIVPLAVYESYGSTEALEQQLGSMRRWVEHLRNRAGDGVVLPTEPFQYGDWLDPDAPGERPWEAKVSSDYVANAFYAHSARLLARAERLVGDADRASDADALADRVAAATWTAWGDEAITTQTGAALALEFDLAPAERRAEIADALAANVRAENGRIATGFLGTPLVLFALSNSGHLAEAYLMLLRRDAPSWLYQVDRGATTVWERWDAILPDGSIHGGAMDAGSGDGGGGSMLSFNHYAYGAMIDWVYRTVAGLAPDADEPGYRLVHVAPRPATGLEHAAASIDTRLGRLAIEWTVENGSLVIDLTVPFGSRAALDLPVSPESTVTIDGATDAAGEVGHGIHQIVVTAPVVVES